MEGLSRFAVLLLAAVAAAQNVTQSIPASYTLNGTTLPNPTAFAASFDWNVEDLWDLLIGPVSIAATTTTVSKLMGSKASLTSLTSRDILDAHIARYLFPHPVVFSTRRMLTLLTFCLQVSPTPVPSSSLIPPPPLYFPPFPTGAVVPAVKKNDSWAFPKDFL